MTTYARAHVSIYQSSTGRVQAFVRYDGDPATYRFECSTIHGSDVSWGVLSKAVRDCLEVGITSCEEYEPY